jgi:hypothetical protein
MAFSIFFAITVILLISFVVTRKNLHVFEILFLWMVIIIIHHNFFTVAAVNLHLFDFGGHLERYWSLVFIRVFLIPLLMIWCFDRTLAEKAHKKWGWLALGILALTGLEYLSDVLLVFRRMAWNYWWSLMEWIVIFLLVEYSWIWYRGLLRKETI